MKHRRQAAWNGLMVAVVFLGVPLACLGAFPFLFSGAHPVGLTGRGGHVALAQGPTPTPTAIAGQAPVTVAPAAVFRAAGGKPGAVARVLMRPEEFIYSLAFSPDGRLLGGGGADTTRIWDAQTGAELHQVNTRGVVPQVAFSPDGRWLANASGDTTWVIDAATGAVRHILHAHTNPQVGLVAFSPDGRLLATEELGGVRLWNPDTGAEVRALRETDVGLAFSADGRVLAIQGTGSYDHSVRLWDTTTDAQISSLHGSLYGSVSEAALSPDGRLLATAGPAHAIKLWDVASGEWLRDLAGQTNSVYSLAVSPNGRLLASGEEDGWVQLWDTPSGQRIQLLVAGTERVSSVAFSPAGHTLASASQDGQVLLWDVHE